jgi:hypothetical protein
MDSIAINYHDKSKRKLFWTLWERKSGNYESYEDFKRSWDPHTSIWDEIKNRTSKDVKADVEGILGVGRNRNGLGYTTMKGIESRGVNVRSEVNKLIHETKPFETNAINSVEPDEPSSKNKKSSSSRKHSHSRSKHTRSNSGSQHKHSRNHHNKHRAK